MGMPSAAGVTERQAADALRTRIAWKDAVSLALPDPGLDLSVLSAFRRRFLANPAARRLFAVLVSQCARTLAAIALLRRIWRPPSQASEPATPGRKEQALAPSAGLLASPSAREARESQKNKTAWAG